MRPLAFVACEYAFIIVGVTVLILGQDLIAVMIFIAGVLFIVAWLHAPGRPPRGW